MLAGIWRKSDMFQCHPTPQIVNHMAVCDGKDDCDNGYDEQESICSKAARVEPGPRVEGGGGGLGGGVVGGGWDGGGGRRGRGREGGWGGGGGSVWGMGNVLLL